MKRPIGCWGDLSVFSFHATKLFHTVEGGAITTLDEAAVRARGQQATRRFWDVIRKGAAH